MNKGRLIVTSIMSITLVLMLMLGSTYSLFTTGSVDEELNVYKTGTLGVTYTVSEDSVVISEKLPISLEDEGTIRPYRVTVTNTGTVPYQFDLVLENTTATDVISSDYIKVKVGYLESVVLGKCENNVIRKDILLPAGESVDIDVRVFLGEDIPNTEIGKSFFAKLKVEGEAVYDLNEEVDNDLLALTYMKVLFNDSEDYSYFRSDEYREKIKNVSFVNYIDTSSVVETWDVSLESDGSVIAWLNNNETEGYYDLYIGAKEVIFTENLDSFFCGMSNIDSISLDNLDTSLVINMGYMFNNTGYNSTSFTLDLGDKFNTSRVTNMNGMFYETGYNSPVFTLDLGDKFDTSNVTDMQYMFRATGYNSTVFTLDLGSKFDTSSVNRMDLMFNYTGYNSTSFTLDLGDKFDTSNVTNMYAMFYETGYSSTVFTLDLGDKFDTSNVTNMYSLFYETGYSSTVFTLDLGDKFDTSNVTNMSQMFKYTGFYSTIFTLDLGSNFDTSAVTMMTDMFWQTGYSSTVFTLDLGDKFDTSNVTNMSGMFLDTGYTNVVFTLNLGESFDTTNVTSMINMFNGVGYNSTIFTLDLGEKFDTSKVVNMAWMFHKTGANNSSFMLDLGDKFDTSNVISMEGMFYGTGYKSTVFTLNFGSKFDTSKVSDMSDMFNNIGNYNTNLVLDLSRLTFDAVTDYEKMFEWFSESQTIYVKSVVEQTWIIDKGFSNCSLTTSNVLIKS